jgi:hypothetical protein
MKSKTLTPNTVTGCTFNGVHWDAQAIGTIQTVADGLLTNTKALHALIDVFKSQNIQIKSMLSMNNTQE